MAQMESTFVNHFFLFLKLFKTKKTNLSRHTLKVSNFICGCLQITREKTITNNVKIDMMTIINAVNSACERIKHIPTIDVT
jgi:hypothetical protein